MQTCMQVYLNSGKGERRKRFVNWAVVVERKKRLGGYRSADFR